MGKPRRPRGSRSTGEPQPPLAADAPVPAAIQADPSPIETAETAKIPDAPGEPAPPSDAAAAAIPAEEPIPESVHAPVPETAESVEAAVEATPDAPAPQADSPAGLDTAPESIPETVSGTGPAGEALPALIAAATPGSPGASGQGAALAPTQVWAQNRIVFAPDRLDVVEIGSTIARYVRGEGEAALAHLRALSGARSPADVIRLQVGEVQRAADASLTCWVTVVGKASRVVAFR